MKSWEASGVEGPSRGSSALPSTFLRVTVTRMEVVAAATVRSATGDADRAAREHDTIRRKKACPLPAAELTGARHNVAGEKDRDINVTVGTTRTMTTTTTEAACRTWSARLALFAGPIADMGRTCRTWRLFPTQVCSTRRVRPGVNRSGSNTCPCTARGRGSWASLRGLESRRRSRSQKVGSRDNLQAKCFDLLRASPTSAIICIT